jgi:hypothetical protein
VILPIQTVSFRPYANGGILDRRVLNVRAADYLQAHGYTVVLWNAVPRDWERRDWVHVALDQCAARPWSLMVLHDRYGRVLPVSRSSCRWRPRQARASVRISPTAVSRCVAATRLPRLHRSSLPHTSRRKNDTHRGGEFMAGQRDRLRELLGTELPIVQAPMAGVQLSALAVAVSNAGGLGSLPCAMLTPDGIRDELTRIAAQTSRPYNVNFFCHTPPPPDAEREAAWRSVLAPYYHELDIDVSSVPSGPLRAPFDSDAADVLDQFKPPVVSFLFGLPPVDLLERVKSWRPVIMSAATTVDEALWLEANGVDVIIAQGLEAGGHRGMFLTNEVTTQIGTFALLPQIVRAVRVPVLAAGGIADAAGVAAALVARRGGSAGRHVLPAVPRSHHTAAASGGTEIDGRTSHRPHQRPDRSAGAHDRQPDRRRKSDHSTARPRRFRWPHRRSCRCAPGQRAEAAPISRRCRPDRTRRDVRSVRQPN